MKKIIVIYLLLISSGIYASSLPSWCTNTNRYLDQVRLYEVEDLFQDNTGKNVFVGSSSFRLWDNFYRDLAGMNAINRGIGGAITCDLLVYQDRIITKYQPKKVFLYIGENDIAGDISPEENSKRIVYLVNSLRKKIPRSKLYFISMKPSPARRRYFSNLKNGNNILKRELSKLGVTYIDIFTAMLTEQGSVRDDIWKSDKLHMNQRGYDLWLPQITPHL